jgi:hypothetical protein
MSDYNNRDPFDPYGNSRFEPVDSGRGPYILLAILVAIGVIGGLLYFNHKPLDQNQAQAPAAKEQPMQTPTPLGSPGGPGSTPGRAPGGESTPGTAPAPTPGTK